MGLIKVRNTYPFGVDPKWHGTRSELPFLNSLKMKMSILLGVAQMNLGIILSYFNAKFYGDDINIRYAKSLKLIFACIHACVEHTTFVRFIRSVFLYCSLVKLLKNF